MWRRSRFFVGAVGIVLLASVGAAVRAQNGSQFKDWRTEALGDAASATPRATCPSLVALTGYDFSINTAVLVAASADAPDYCRVSGLIQPEIRFEVSLPAGWNGRLYMFGNGGYAGEDLDSPARINTTRRALSHGFAVAQTNTGHDAGLEPLGTFAANPQKLVDYAYRAVHVTALTAKTIIDTYYPGPVRRSYFDGCSTGGREGLISAQRFPDDFDGIVAGAPVLNFSGTMIGYLTNQRALAAAPISPAKLKVLADTVYAKCDEADGLKDGVIDDPRRCQFKPSVDLPRCAGQAGENEEQGCFTGRQIQALEAIYGWTTRNGEHFFPGWPVGAEIATPAANGSSVSGWVPWFVGLPNAPNARSIETSFAETFFKNMAFGRVLPDYDWTTFNLAGDLDKIQATRAALDATNPDLSRFKARGGKIVSYFGWADPALNPLMGVGYYESVEQHMGAAAADFYRLFMVPGMFHCGGGVGVSTFDAFTPLVEWVEKGVVPQKIVGSRIVNGSVVRTRPLCPYPEVAKYQGTGSIDEAKNFACVKPTP